MGEVAWVKVRLRSGQDLVKLVADAAHAQDMLWPVRVIFQLSSKRCDVRVDYPWRDGKVLAPDRIQEFVAGDDFA